MVQQITWTKRALHDLREMYDFIAQDSPRYAQSEIEKAQRVVSRLIQFPAMGRIVPEFPLYRTENCFPEATASSIEWMNHQIVF